MKTIIPIAGKSVYLFEIDDILYPKKDFILQIYYLFGEFVAYTEARPIAQDIVHYMKRQYEAHGETDVLAKTHDRFNLKQDYSENFGRLMVNAHLPLKLVLFEEIKESFRTLTNAGNQIAILTAGNPLLQLNKLKHIDWEGWDKSLKIYFADELLFRNIKPFDYIAGEFGVDVTNLIHFQ